MREGEGRAKAARIESPPAPSFGEKMEVGGPHYESKDHICFIDLIGNRGIKSFLILIDFFQYFKATTYYKV